MSKLVAGLIDGVLGIHAPGAASDYDTLCGLDLSDPEIGAVRATLPPKAKIDCEQCRSIWEMARSIRESDFA